MVPFVRSGERRETADLRVLTGGDDGWGIVLDGWPDQNDPIGEFGANHRRRHGTTMPHRTRRRPTNFVTVHVVTRRRLQRWDRSSVTTTRVGYHSALDLRGAPEFGTRVAPGNALEVRYDIQRAAERRVKSNPAE